MRTEAPARSSAMSAQAAERPAANMSAVRPSASASSTDAPPATSASTPSALSAEAASISACGRALTVSPHRSPCTVIGDQCGERHAALPRHRQHPQLPLHCKCDRCGHFGVEQAETSTLRSFRSMSAGMHRRLTAEDRMLTAALQLTRLPYRSLSAWKALDAINVQLRSDGRG